MHMDLSAILMNGLWAGLSGTALAILITAPPSYLAATFCCAFSGRLVRDLLITSGAGPNWSTALAAAVVVLVAVAVIRRHRASPVVLICGVLPLGAAAAMFNMLFELMKLSTARDGALNTVSVAFTSNLAKVFVTSLSIALGIGAGMAIVRLVRRDGVVAV